MSKCTITNKRASRARIYQKQSFAKSFNPSAFPYFILIIREKLAERFENQTLHKSAFALRRSARFSDGGWRWCRGMKQADIWEENWERRKNPRFHRRFCPFRSSASFLTCGTKGNGAKPPFGRSVAGIEQSVPGVRASIAGFVRTGRIDVCQ